MTPPPSLRRGGALIMRLLAPALLTLLPLAVWTTVARALIKGELPGGGWVWALLPPVLALEWIAHRTVDAARRGGRARLLGLVGVLGRLGVHGACFYLLVGRTARLLNTVDLVGPLLVYWPEVSGFAYIASPLLGAAGGGGLLALHVWLTVWQGRLRLTTTLTLPLVFTFVLFNVFYTFPTSPIHGVYPQPEPPVERVFPFEDEGANDPAMRTPFAPRALHVTQDETVIVASYGPSFYLFGDPEEMNRGPDLARIDLGSQRVEYRRGPPIRRFHSTCSERLYAAPWLEPTLLEIDPATFEINEIELPARMNDELVEEINVVLHDCEARRVYVGNSRNPIIFVWNTETRSLEKTLNLSELGWMPLGSHVGALSRNPLSGGAYLFLNGRWSIIDLAPDTLDAVRFGSTPGFPIDIQVSGDGAWLYSTSFLKGEGWRINARTFELVKTYDIPVHCRRVAVSADGAHLFVLSYLTGELITLDADSGDELSRYFVGPKAEGLYLSKSYAWMSTAAGIFRLPLDVLIP
jgi:hypothetical protein